MSALRCGRKLAVLLTLGVACAAPRVTRDVTAVMAVPAGLDRYRPVPEDNALTPAKVALGRRLFFDSLLAADRSLACASCHDPRHGFTNGRPVSKGVYGRTGRRNVPTLVNRAYGRAFFWDGRVTTLEDQVLHPIRDSLELDLPIARAVARLREDPAYDSGFIGAFGVPPDSQSLGRALASFVRTVLSGGSRYDAWVQGDSGALSAEEKAGFRVFSGKGQCTTCHVPPTFTDEQFHHTGIALRNGEIADSGRYLVSAKPREIGAFKTPTLREVGRTAPYMHDGSFPTLESIVDYYDRGGNRGPLLDAGIHLLGLSPQEKRALVAFLRALSDTTSPERLRP